jgi:hypothetical protein
MDSNPLERERGITILSKNCAVNYHADRRDDYRVNIVDTPGHADFGGEVERVLRMADGCLLLVDAFEGPMPQTRFVLARRSRRGSSRSWSSTSATARRRPHEVVDEVFDLLVDLGADDTRSTSPCLRAARDGWAVDDGPRDYEAGTCARIFEAIVSTCPPRGRPDRRCRCSSRRSTTRTTSGGSASGACSRARSRRAARRLVTSTTDAKPSGQGRQAAAASRASGASRSTGRGGRPVRRRRRRGRFDIGDTICDPDHPESRSRR